MGGDFFLAFGTSVDNIALLSIFLKASPVRQTTPLARAQRTHDYTLRLHRRKHHLRLPADAHPDRRLLLSQAEESGRIFPRQPHHELAAYWHVFDGGAEQRHGLPHAALVDHHLWAGRNYQRVQLVL